jgi:hypothetical protein
MIARSFPSFRHSREGGDPAFFPHYAGILQSGIPAFAGMTVWESSFAKIILD